MKVITNSIAKVDFIDALKYYKKISDKLALQFIHQLEVTKKIIGKNPLHIAVKYSNVRVVLLKQFPYHIHFFIDNVNNCIVVIAIVFAGKKPTDYLER